jgi:uncharacterized membrane protein (UPF0127 family)
VCNATDMAWLVSDGRVLASAELAAGRKEKARGLLGRDGLEGALILDRCRWVHTVGMRFPIDVAYVDGDGRVVKTVQMRRGRVGVPVFSARYVIEASAGAFARWGLRVGDIVEIRADDTTAMPPLARPAPPAADDDDGRTDQRRVRVVATSR